MGNTHTHRIKQTVEELDTTVYGFGDCIGTSTPVDHITDIIRLGNKWLDSQDDVDYQLTCPRVLDLTKSDTKHKTMMNVCRERIIMDPMFPVMEWTTVNDNCDFFGQQFGILFQKNDNSWYARVVTT